MGGPMGGPPGGPTSGTSVAVIGGGVPVLAQAGRGPKTRAELTNYEETSRYQDVVEFMKAVDAASPLIHLTTMGYTFEGRAIPMAVVGRVKNATPEAVKASGKTRVYFQGNIHAGEVEGKEASLGFCGRSPEASTRRGSTPMVLLVSPIYNADGNERVALTNRGGQNGPIGGMGQRTTAQGYDLNRDFVKLDAPESRSFELMMARYDPHVAIDQHTTDGSAHAYHLTYAPPMHPITAPSVVDMARNQLLPAVTKAIKAKDGWDFYYYGNAGGPRPGGQQRERAWSAAELGTGRFSNNFIGLRNRIGILAETYAYLTFKERIAATRRFVEEILAFVHTNAAAVRRACDEADKASIVGQEVALTAKVARSPEPVEILLGEVTTERNPYTGQMMRRRVDVRKPEKMPVYISFEAAESTVAPHAYLVPPSLRQVIDRLEGHAIQSGGLQEATSLAVDRFRVTSTTVAEREYQGHKARTISGSWESAEESVPAGTLVVPVDQPLGRLIVLMLEPRSEDSLAAWNMMEEALGGQTPAYPVLRSRIASAAAK